MSRKRYSIDQLNTKLREAKVRISRGKTVALACNAYEVTEPTYYPWHKQYGGLKTDPAKHLKELEKDNARLRGWRRRRLVAAVTAQLEVLERRACKATGQPRSTQRYQRRALDDEAVLRSDTIAHAAQYSRYGCKRITAHVRPRGWHVNRNQVARTWRDEGFKVTREQPNERTAVAARWQVWAHAAGD